MMGVYIKGMDMPTHCDLCDFTTWDSNAGESRCFFTGHYTSANYDLLHGDCPLVPVPSHGRLIDADALYERYRIEERTLDKPYVDYLGILAAETPTIITAEEGE